MTDTGSLNLTSTPITVPLDLPSSAFDNVDFSNPNAITIDEAGTYLILITMSGRSISASSTTSVSLGLAINGTAQVDTMQAQEFSSAELNTFMVSNIISLAAGAQLSLLISSDPETLFSTPQLGQSGSIVVLRID